MKDFNIIENDVNNILDDNPSRVGPWDHPKLTLECYYEKLETFYQKKCFTKILLESIDDGKNRYLGEVCDLLADLNITEANEKIITICDCLLSDEYLNNSVETQFVLAAVGKIAPDEIFKRVNKILRFCLLSKDDYIIHCPLFHLRRIYGEEKLAAIISEMMILAKNKYPELLPFIIETSQNMLSDDFPYNPTILIADPNKSIFENLKANGVDIEGIVIKDKNKRSMNTKVPIIIKIFAEIKNWFSGLNK